MAGYVPTEEAVAYFREALERDLKRMEEMSEKVGDERRPGWEKAIRMVRYMTLGNESGCVVTAFDRRGPKLREQWVAPGEVSL